MKQTSAISSQLTCDVMPCDAHSCFAALLLHNSQATGCLFKHHHCVPARLRPLTSRNEGFGDSMDPCAIQFRQYLLK